MYRYQVGQPYLPGRSLLTPAVQYNFRAGHHELLMILSGITAREEHAIRKGTAHFALYVEPPQIVLLYRFGSMPWSDTPFSVHLVPARERQPPQPLAAAERVLLQVVLVEADGGLIRGLRALTLTPELSQALHAAIADQAARPWDPAAYDRGLAELYARYGSSDALLRDAQVRGRAG